MAEVVIASAIIGIITTTLMASISAVMKIGYRNTPYIQSALLAEEGAEALRVMRDTSWSSNIASLSNGTNYRFYFDSSASTYTATTTYFLIDSKFDRTFSLSAVSRDNNHDVVSSGGTNDSNSRKATITVSWRENNATTTKVIETYISNAFEN